MAEKVLIDNSLLSSTRTGINRAAASLAEFLIETGAAVIAEPVVRQIALGIHKLDPEGDREKRAAIESWRDGHLARCGGFEAPTAEDIETWAELSNIPSLKYYHHLDPRANQQYEKQFLMLAAMSISRGWPVAAASRAPYVLLNASEERVRVITPETFSAGLFARRSIT